MGKGEQSAGYHVSLAEQPCRKTRPYVTQSSKLFHKTVVATKSRGRIKESGWYEQAGSERRPEPSPVFHVRGREREGEEGGIVYAFTAS